MPRKSNQLSSKLLNAGDACDQSVGNVAGTDAAADDLPCHRRNGVGVPPDLDDAAQPAGKLTRLRLLCREQRERDRFDHIAGISVLRRQLLERRERVDSREFE